MQTSSKPHCAAHAVIGINNRNLKTFDTRLETTLELLPRIQTRGLW